jgi:hypothetical protein
MATRTATTLVVVAMLTACRFLADKAVFVARRPSRPLAELWREWRDFS